MSRTASIRLAARLLRVEYRRDQVTGLQISVSLPLTEEAGQ